MKRRFLSMVILSLFSLFLLGWGASLALALPNTIVFVSPAPGETIHPSSTVDYLIQWDSSASPDAVEFRLYYSPDNGATWFSASGGKVPGPTYAASILPPDAGNKWIKLKIVGYNNLNKKVAMGITDVYLEVIKLISPDTGAGPFQSGQPASISWVVWETVDPIRIVKLLYTTNGGLTWKKIPGTPLGAPYTNQNASHTYDFNWPDVPRQKTKCKVKVTLIPFPGQGDFPTMGKEKSEEFTIDP